jgi:hypothetical protein
MLTLVSHNVPEQLLCANRGPPDAGAGSTRRQPSVESRSDEAPPTQNRQPDSRWGSSSARLADDKGIAGRRPVPSCTKQRPTNMPMLRSAQCFAKANAGSSSAWRSESARRSTSRTSRAVRCAASFRASGNQPTPLRSTLTAHRSNETRILPVGRWRKDLTRYRRRCLCTGGAAGVVVQRP